jgi:hypothetical protein
MGALKSRKTLRASPRLKLSEDKRRIRFTNSAQKKIFSTTIFDISESGISFISTQKMAPRIGDIISLEFTPVDSMRMACKARVVRIETPSKHSTWDSFPESIKVGLEYYNLPGAYQKMIAQSLEKAFSSKKIKTQEVFEVSGSTGRSWFSQNWASLLATIALILGTIIGSYLIWKDSEGRAPASPEWSKNVFEKIKSEK